MNYSETYFELDSEEATHCHHCHLISCVYIKGHVSIHCSKDQSNACMCENDVEGAKRSLNSFNCYSCYSSRKSRKWCLWLLHNTVYRVMLLILLMLKRLKVYSVYSGPSPLQGEGYLFEPSALWVQWFTTSQSEEAVLLTFLDLSTTRVIAGKTLSQSPILKTKGCSATQ